MEVVEGWDSSGEDRVIGGSVQPLFGVVTDVE